MDAENSGADATCQFLEDSHQHFLALRDHIDLAIRANREALADYTGGAIPTRLPAKIATLCRSAAGVPGPLIASWCAIVPLVVIQVALIATTEATSPPEPALIVHSRTLHNPVVRPGDKLQFSAMIQRARECNYEWTHHYLRADDLSSVDRQTYSGAVAPIRVGIYSWDFDIAVPKIEPGEYQFRTIFKELCGNGVRFTTLPDVKFIVI